MAYIKIYIKSAEDVETPTYVLNPVDTVDVKNEFNSVDNNIAANVKLTATVADLSKLKIYNVGSEGSYVDIASVLDPTDWRGYKFSEHENYWGYYGPFSVKFELENAEAFMNGSWIKVPSTIVLAYLFLRNRYVRGKKAPSR